MFNKSKTKKLEGYLPKTQKWISMDGFVSKAQAAHFNPQFTKIRERLK